MFGRYSQINSSEVLGIAKESLGIGSTTEWDGLLTGWLNWGIKGLRCHSLFSKMEEDIDIEDGEGLIPCGYHQLLKMAYIFNDETSMIGLPKIWYIDRNYLSTVGIIPTSSGYVDYRMAGIDFNEGKVLVPVGVNVTRVKMLFWGMNKSVDGKTLNIYENYERALASFLSYKWCQKFHDKYPRDIRNEHMRDYVAQKEVLAAEDDLHEWQNKEEEMQLILKTMFVG